jgi:hypothetical protein
VILTKEQFLKMLHSTKAVCTVHDDRNTGRKLNKCSFDYPEGSMVLYRENPLHNWSNLSRAQTRADAALWITRANQNYIVSSITDMTHEEMVHAVITKVMADKGKHHKQLDFDAVVTRLLESIV